MHAEKKNGIRAVSYYKSVNACSSYMTHVHTGDENGVKCGLARCDVGCKVGLWVISIDDLK